MPAIWHVRDLVDLRRGQFRVHRDRQRLGARALGVREGAGTVAQAREAGLQVQRFGVVDLGADAAGSRVRPHQVKALHRGLLRRLFLAHLPG